MLRVLFAAIVFVTSCCAQPTPPPRSTTRPTLITDSSAQSPTPPTSNPQPGCIGETISSMVGGQGGNASRRLLVVYERGYAPLRISSDNTPMPTQSVAISSTADDTIDPRNRGIKLVEEDQVVCSDKLTPEVGTGPPPNDSIQGDGISVAGTSTNRPALRWNIDRVDQRHLPLNQKYCPIYDGSGVDIYILDTGINYDHEVFDVSRPSSCVEGRRPGGRARDGGYDQFRNRNDHNHGRDDHGHGTHCAGLAAGHQTGVATGARVYSIKVLGSNLGGFFSYIIAGINHVIDRARASGRRTVISMSLIGPKTLAVNEAIREAVQAGIVVVTAAGNFRSDSCDYSPSSSPDVINVGGTQEDGDQLYWFNSRSNSPGSNWGRCVDIFAPGQWILSAGHLCDCCVVSMSGTSMSCPIVAGAVAILLQRFPNYTPQQIKNQLIQESTGGVVNLYTFQGGQLSSSVATSPNRLLYVLSRSSCQVDTTPTSTPTNGPPGTQPPATQPPTPPADCLFEGNSYPHDSEIVTESINCFTRCFCTDGVVDCIRDKCYDAHCRVYSDPHFFTFDGRAYSFHGAGDYILMKLCDSDDIRIEITHDVLESGAARIAKATILVQSIGANIILVSSTVSINGETLSEEAAAQETLDQLTIQRIGGNIQVTFEDTGINVIWDPRGNIKISAIKRNLFKKVCGLCGNYNGRAKDDFRKPDGTRVKTVSEFGFSWLSGNGPSTLEEQPVSKCGSRLTERGEAFCDVLNQEPFTSCHSQVDPAQYIEDCKYDYCNCNPGRGNKEQCSCDVIATYAQNCADSGIVIDNWRDAATCEIQCPSGMVYKQCGPFCQLTCENYRNHPACSKDCVPGCFCPDNRVLDTRSGTCVRRGRCDAPVCNGIDLGRGTDLYERFFAPQINEIIDTFLRRSQVLCFITVHDDTVGPVFSAIFCTVSDPSSYIIMINEKPNVIHKKIKEVRRTHKIVICTCYYDENDMYRCIVVLERNRNRVTTFITQVPYAEYQQRLIKLQNRDKSQRVLARNIYFDEGRLYVDAIFRAQHLVSLRDQITLTNLKETVKTNKQNGFYLTDGNARVVNGQIVYSVVFTSIQYGECECLVEYELNTMQLSHRTRQLAKNGYHLKVIIPTTETLTVQFIAVYWR